MSSSAVTDASLPPWEDARTFPSGVVPALPTTLSLGQAVCEEARNIESVHHAVLAQQSSSHVGPCSSKSFRNGVWRDQLRPQCRSASQILSSPFVSEGSQHRKSLGKLSRMLIRIDSVSTKRQTIQSPGAFRRLLSNLTAEAPGSHGGHIVRTDDRCRTGGDWHRRGKSVRLLLAVGFLLSMFFLTSAFFVRRSPGGPTRERTGLVPGSGVLPRNSADNQTSGDAADGHYLKSASNMVGVGAFGHNRTHVSSPLHTGVTEFLVASATNRTERLSQ